MITKETITKCAWGMGSTCGGDTSNKGMFGNQIMVPVCESHYKEHLVLLTLNRKFSKDIEELLGLSYQERIDMLSGLTTDIDGALKETAEIDTNARPATVQ